MGGGEPLPLSWRVISLNLITKEKRPRRTNQEEQLNFLSRGTKIILPCQEYEKDGTTIIISFKLIPQRKRLRRTQNISFDGD